MIWWNGVSSDDLHLYVERYPNRKLPSRKTTFYSLPNRTGDLVYQQNAWENYSQAYDIYISAEDRKLPNAMVAINAWLYGPNGYAKLEDSYDLDTYRLATFVGGQDIENSLNRFGRATIEFNCKPQRWLKSGESLIELTQYAYPMYKKLRNPTGLPTKPYISLDGTGTIDICCKNGIVLHLDDITNINGVDCDSLEIFAPHTVSNPYGQVGLPDWEIPAGEYVELCVALEEHITLSYVGIKPRWYTL